MANALTDFRQDHHVILGVFLLAVGAFGVLGSVTGRLPAMIAGLFDPSDLVGTSTGSSSGLLQDEGVTGSNVSSLSGTAPASEAIGSGFVADFESIAGGFL